MTLDLGENQIPTARHAVSIASVPSVTIEKTTDGRLGAGSQIDSVIERPEEVTTNPVALIGTSQEQRQQLMTHRLTDPERPHIDESATVFLGFRPQPSRVNLLEGGPVNGTPTTLLQKILKTVEELSNVLNLRRLVVKKQRGALVPEKEAREIRLAVVSEFLPAGVPLRPKLADRRSGRYEGAVSAIRTLIRVGD